MQILPDAMMAVLANFDALPHAFTESDLRSALKASVPSDLCDVHRAAWLAETYAFTFLEGSRCSSSEWGTYFCPSISGTKADGTKAYLPDVANIDRPMIEYWRVRADEAKHPVFRARYADLVWDFERRVTGDRADPRYARQAIDAYTAASEIMVTMPDDPGPVVDARTRLGRALGLALSLNDKGRVESVAEAMIRLFERVAEPTMIGSWNFVFDDLYHNPKVVLTEHQRQRLLRFLEQSLELVSDSSRPSTFSTWAAEGIADHLVKVYGSAGKPEEVARVVRTAGHAFEDIAAKADAVVAMAWLQKLQERYRSFGLKDDAKRVQLQAKAKGGSAVDSMPRIRASISISAGDVDAFVDQLTVGNVYEALTRIATGFIPDVADAKEVLERSREKAPLEASIAIVSIADGQFVAEVGAVDDDPDGRLRHVIAEHLALETPLLALALDAVVAKYSITADAFLDFVSRSPLADPERRRFLSEAFAAYLDGDHIKMIHVFVPQLEHLLRRLLALLGEPTNKSKGTQGVMQEKNWNDILDDESVKAVMPDGLRLYLRTYFADPRGQNVRHRLSHGLLSPVDCTRVISDRLIHAVLALTAWSHDSLV